MRGASHQTPWTRCKWHRSAGCLSAGDKGFLAHRELAHLSARQVSLSRQKTVVRVREFGPLDRNMEDGD